MIKRTCEICGAEFSVRPFVVKSPNGGRFCSVGCKYQWMRTLVSEKAGGWKGGKVERTCEICGKTFSVPPNYVSRGIGKLCSPECRSIRKSHLATRENNHNWIHGDRLLSKRMSQSKRRFKIAESPCNVTYLEWEEIKRVFNFTCPSCGKSEPEIKLTMDHITPVIKNGDNSRDNIQPLCRKCNTSKYTKSRMYNIDGSYTEITDLKALCLAVATGKVSPESVTANMPVLNRLAVALKGTMNIPGVKAYSKRV